MIFIFANILNQRIDWNTIFVIYVISLFLCLMVFNATFNNISVIWWRSVLLVEETWAPGENHRPRKQLLIIKFITKAIYECACVYKYIDIFTVWGSFMCSWVFWYFCRWRFPLTVTMIIPYLDFINLIWSQCISSITFSSSPQSRGGGIQFNAIW